VSVWKFGLEKKFRTLIIFRSLKITLLFKNYVSNWVWVKEANNSLWHRHSFATVTFCSIWNNCDFFASIRGTNNSFQSVMMVKTCVWQNLLWPSFGDSSRTETSQKDAQTLSLFAIYFNIHWISCWELWWFLWYSQYVTHQNGLDIKFKSYYHHWNTSRLFQGN